MAEEPQAEKQRLVLLLPEGIAKRLQLAATRANLTVTEMALEVLNRNLPRLDTGVKRAPYT